MVNDTNFNDAVWSNYDGTVYLQLPPTDGVYQVWIGLKGIATNATPAWMGTQVYLDRVAPLVGITNPVSGTVTTPYVQVQGFANEELLSVTYDLSNAVTVLTNQPANITGYFLDTNLQAYTTDYFQCYDLLLTNGVNAVSVHCTDLAGNITTTNFTLTLDYSTATNPEIGLAWPQDAMQVSGNSFILSGLTGDSSSRITATFIDSDGNTNLAFGIIDRTGRYRVPNLPLSAGTNSVTLSISNSAGYSSTTNFSVIKSDMTLDLNSISGDLWLPTTGAGGDISDLHAAIWINGIQGTNNGDGTWTATNVPVSAGGEAYFVVQAVSTNGTSVEFLTNFDKPSEQVIRSAAWGESGISQDYPGDSWIAYNFEGAYSLENGGRYQMHYSYQDPDTDLVILDEDYIYTLAPGGAVTDRLWTNSEGDFEDTPYGSVTIPLQEGSLGMQNPANAPWPLTAEEHAHVKMNYFVGGTAIPGVQNAMAWTASATRVLTQSSYFNPFVPGSNLPNSEISVGQLGRLNASGFVGGAAKPGATVDVTPAADAPMALVSGDSTNDYTIHIIANGTDISIYSNNLTVCVGQQVQLEATCPGASGVTFSNVSWHLDGTYVNDATNGTNAYPDCSINYFFNPTLLQSNPIAVWWITGVNPIIECLISINANLYRGTNWIQQFSTHSPLYVYTPLADGYYPITPVQPLVEHKHNYQGNAFDVLHGGQAQFKVDISSIHGGYVKSIQLINGTATNTSLVADTYGIYWLDDLGAGNYIPKQVVTNLSFTFYDDPQIGCVGGTMMNWSFTNYISYNPDISNSADIYVTLGTIKWITSASTYLSTNGIGVIDYVPFRDASSAEPFQTNLSNIGYIDPTLSRSYALPTWTRRLIDNTNNNN